MSTKSDGIQTTLQALISDVQRLIVSPKDISDRLAHLSEGMFAKKLQIVITQAGTQYAWGEIDKVPPQVVQSGNLGGDVEFEVRAEAWPKALGEQTLLPLFRDLAQALWGQDMRPMGGISWKRESVRNRLAASIKHLSGGSDGGAVAVIFADLDKFKSLNDAAGHTVGDDAIRFVNGALHAMCQRHGGLPFHPSGDEFYIVLPMANLLEMLSALYELRLAILNKSFPGKNDTELFIDLTLGMQILSHEITYEAVEQGLREAEDATKDSNGKRRGKLSVAQPANLSGSVVSPSEFAKLGAVMVRRRPGPQGPFPDARLGLVMVRVERVYRSTGDNLDIEVSSVLKWLGVRRSSKCTAESLLLQVGPSDIPDLAIALAVAAGILRAQSRGDTGALPAMDVIFGAKGSAALQIGGLEVWGACPVVKGRASVLSDPSKHATDCVIGVQVGLSSTPKFSGTTVDIPTDLLNCVVIVDDRPNTGGGLPDFWQAALAQICEIGVRHGGAVHVLMWGQLAAHSETYRRLVGEKEWSVDEVSALAGVAASQVNILRDKLTKNTHIVTPVQLSHSMYELLALRDNVDCNENEKMGDADALHREMLSRPPLEPTDGLRCIDAAQAYPLIIDVLRKADARLSSDDARQELRELIAFKLVLQSPGSNFVPAYLKSQEPDMSYYFERVLASPDGQLRRPLERTGQIEPFINQLAACFDSAGDRKSTRRACLVVPHEPPLGSLPTPSGLVSIWASPRIVENQRQHVDFVCVWRTVEAFVGLPYSLYGSVRFCQYLLQKVNSKLAGAKIPPELRLGELTYLALSLHMRVDGVHRRIAKRIVDESSD